MFCAFTPSVTEQSSNLNRPFSLEALRPALEILNALFLGNGSGLRDWHGLMVLLEFGRGQVVQAHMGTHGVVVLAPRFDDDAGFAATAKPFQAQTLVAELTVERFIRSVLPRLPGIGQGGVNAVLDEPLEDRLAHELRAGLELAPVSRTSDCW